jgi:peptidyl-prolyl cis-trans isomerase D
MLGFFRQRSGGIFSIVIIGAIALVFVFWGIGGQDSGGGEDIRINGRSVSTRAYAEIQENVLEQARQSGRSLSAEEELNARRQALAFLVERQSLLELARQTGRTASVQEINRTVKSNPNFQRDGRFSLELYEEAVPRYYNRSLAAFESGVAEDLLVNEAVSLIQDLSYAPKGAVIDDWRFAEDELVLDHAFFPAKARLEGLEPTDEELAAFHEANRERWRRPAKTTIEYVEVDINSFIDQVEVTESDLEDAFLEAGATLTSPETAEVSHILLRFQSLTPTDEERASKLLEAQAALERAKTEDFAKLAEELSQDAASAAQGGSLGEIGRGQTLPTFEEAVFGPGKDALGEIQGPIETMFGWHLIRVDAYNPSHTKTLDEARPELEDLVRRRQARRLAVDRVEDLLEALPASGEAADLARTAAAAGLTAKLSEPFSGVDDAPAFFGGDQGLIETALAAPVGRVGDPLDTPDHLVVYAPTGRTDSFLPTLDDAEIKTAVAQAWRDERASTLARAEADAFLAAAAERGWDPAVSALPETAERGRTEPFARLRFYEAGARLTEVDPDELLDNYFTLAKVGDRVAAPLRVEGDDPGWLILQVADIQPADESTLTEAQLAQRRQDQRASLGEAAYNWWAVNSQATAKVQLPPVIEAMIAGDTDL